MQPPESRYPRIDRALALKRPQPSSHEKRLSKAVVAVTTKSTTMTFMGERVATVTPTSTTTRINPTMRPQLRLRPQKSRPVQEQTHQGEHIHWEQEQQEMHVRQQHEQQQEQQQRQHEHAVCQSVKEPLKMAGEVDALVSSLVVRPMGKNMLKVVQDVVSARLRRLAGLMFSR